MPSFMAFFTGWVNAVELTTATAIPFAFDEMAELVALTISGMLALSEPVQAGVGIFSRAAASARPYWVGTKNGLVVTWLTKVNFHAGVDGKSPAVCLAVLPLVVVLDEQAASSAEAAAVALTRPVPVSSFRRGGAILHVEGIDRLFDLGVDVSHLTSRQVIRRTSVQSVPAGPGAAGDVRPCLHDVDRVRTPAKELDPGPRRTPPANSPGSLHGLPSIRRRNSRIGPPSESRAAPL